MGFGGEVGDDLAKSRYICLVNGKKIITGRHKFEVVKRKIGHCFQL